MMLSVDGLTKRFSGLVAVDDASLVAPAGKITGLIGPNGAGKTTLFAMAAGFLTPDAGTVTFAGEDVTRLPAHARMARGMAYTFQITSIFANLPLFDNVALAVQRRLAPGQSLGSEVEAALARVGLDDRLDQPAGDLSYGHQRLLEIAMGLAQRPRLLILDEPTQGLSDGEIEGFKALVREVARDATVLLIEHNMDVVMSLADRITVLDMGAVLAEGTPAEIHADPAVQRAYLGG